MSQSNQRWKVLPHGRVSQIDDRMLSVVGNLRMPLMTLPRRMTVVRLNDSRLVIWSGCLLPKETREVLQSTPLGSRLTAIARSSAGVCWSEPRRSARRQRLSVGVQRCYVHFLR
jgi:hypothetical protein